MKNYLHSDTLPQRFGARWPQHLKDRLIVEKFGAKQYRGCLQLYPHLIAYLLAVLCWPEYNLFTRLKFIVWAISVFAVPTHVLKKMPGVAGPNVRLL